MEIKPNGTKRWIKHYFTQTWYLLAYWWFRISGVKSDQDTRNALPIRPGRPLQELITEEMYAVAIID